MGVTYCSVLRCKQKGYTDNSGNKVTYHRVPSAGPLRKLWLQKIRRRDFFYKPTAHVNVCSLHFNEDDFLKKFANKKRYLVDNALPSKFEWCSMSESVRKLQTDTEPRLTCPIKQGLECNSRKSTTLITSTNELMSDDTSTQLLNPVNETNGSEQVSGAIESLPNNVIDGKELNPVIEADTSEQDSSTNVLMANNDIVNQEINVNDQTPDTNASENLKLRKLIEELESKLRAKETQYNLLNEKFNQYKTKLKDEIAKNIHLLTQIKKISMNIEAIKDSDEDISFYTGLPDYGKLMALYEFLNPGSNGENIIWWRGANSKASQSPAGRPRKLPVMDQFLMVLMRLRLGLFVKDLARRFGVSNSVVSVTCISWINYMYLQLGQINIWPTRQQVDDTMPEDFKTHYPTTRVIIDATEIKCETPKSLVLQSGTYSSYKSCNTYKGLIGISPFGSVTFVSALYTGNISDKELTKRSGFLKMDFTPNCSVMADKGFLIADMLKEIHVSLNIPPFLKDKGQFSKEESTATEKIAALRIHVERRINRIKNFHIFDRPIPISLSMVVNQLWTVAAMLTNLQNPLIQTSNSDPNLDSLDDSSFDL